MATNYKDRVSEAKLSIRAGLRASLCKSSLSVHNLTSILISTLGDVTKDASATIEFTRYEIGIVRKYHVKLVGWNHPQWANPSDLKGGIEALENIVSAIANHTCRFVEITAEEVEERRRKIADGAVMTPETEPPPSPPPSVLPSESTPPPLSALASSAPDMSVVRPSLDVLPDVLHTPVPFDVPDVLESESWPPLQPVAEITDDLIDPSLLALNRGMSTYRHSFTSLYLHKIKQILKILPRMMALP